MKIFIFILIFSISISCNKKIEVFQPKVEDDLIFIDYKKRISELEAEHEDIKKSIESVLLRIKDPDLSPKLVEMAKADTFVEKKHLEMISQKIAHLKMSANERSHYYLENAHNITKETIQADYSTYEVDEKNKIVKYPWRLRPRLKLPEKINPIDMPKSSTPEKNGGGKH